MDERINRVAALANIGDYGQKSQREYVDGAPHVKHARLRALYAKLVVQVYDAATNLSHPPSVLDLGAGDGAVTLPFLELGAHVTAVDISSSQLDLLRRKCARFADKLDMRCEDATATLARGDRLYDIIVANSFLHHVPDYLGMIGRAVELLEPAGQFFSFQDPMRYDSVGAFTGSFDKMAYFSWRIFKGDVVAGLKRRYRRSRGVYLENSIHDNAEYHAARGGVDQNAIFGLLSSMNFDCKIIPYFSTQSRVFQWLGSGLGLKNTFSVWARRKQ